MKLVNKLNVSKEEFYNFLCENLKKEINSKVIKEGMKFKKELISKFNARAESTVEITSLKENEKYGLKFYTPIGINTIDYTIKEIEPNLIEIIYEEKYISDSTLKNLNNAIMECVFYFGIKKKKRQLFKAIEEYIIFERNNK